jgi:hypothetical protein
MIAHDPLHRSGRAELPHPAPTLGEDAQAHERIGMTDTSRLLAQQGIYFTAQYPTCTSPCQRFDAALAGGSAWLGAVVIR